MGYRRGPLRPAWRAHQDRKKTKKQQQQQTPQTIKIPCQDLSGPQANNLSYKLSLSNVIALGALELKSGALFQLDEFNY